MRTLLTSLAVMLLLGCGDSGENCNTTLNCEDDIEMVCDPPTTSEDEDGNTVTIVACTYVTYEHCFEKTVCTKND